MQNFLLFACKHMTEALVAIGILSTVHAQAEPKIAVASLLGDKFTIVKSQWQTGTHLDPNKKWEIALSGEGLNGDLLLSTERSLKKSCRECSVAFLKVNADSEQNSTQESTVLNELLTTAKNADASRLLVLSKHHAPTHLKTENSSVGQGYLTGLGYVVDYNQRMHRSDTRERGRGYLAPYAYFKIQLIDVGTGETILREACIPSTTRAASRAEDGDPWHAIPEEKKIPMLLGLVRKELDRVLALNVDKLREQKQDQARPELSKE